MGCSHRTARRFDQCGHCGSINACLPLILREDDDPDAPSDTTTPDPCVPLTTFRDAPVARYRSATPWDLALGGPETPGIAIGSSILVSGRRGTFKTTELLRMAAAYGAGAAFCPLEIGQGAEQMRQIATRCGFAITEHLVVPPCTDLEGVCESLCARRRKLVVVDSLSTFRDPVEAFGKLRAATPKATLFLIVHMNKSGQMAHAEQLAHDCDTIVRLTRTHILVETKNRYGPTPVRVRR